MRFAGGTITQGYAWAEYLSMLHTRVALRKPSAEPPPHANNPA